MVGHLASQVLFPVFTGGLMLGCRAIDRGQPLTVNHLFAGFSERAGPLIVLGLLYTGIAIAITLTVAGILLVFSARRCSTQLFRLSDPFAASAVLGGALMVVADRRAAVPAAFPAAGDGDLVRAGAGRAARSGAVGGDERCRSAGACSNVMPFLIYGLIGIVLAVVATIPFALGWLVVGPVTIASIYTSYCDIFEDASGPVN